MQRFKQGEELSAKIVDGSITDKDGTKNVSYAWTRKVASQTKNDGEEITHTTIPVGESNSRTYTLVQDDVDHEIELVVTHTDKDGNETTFKSSTGKIQNSQFKAQGRKEIVHAACIS